MAGHEGWPGTKVNNCSLPKCMEAQPLPSSSAPVKLLNSAVQEKECTDHRPGRPASRGLTLPLAITFCVTLCKSQCLSGLQHHLCESGVHVPLPTG